ncbi:MAG: hypothetical protein ACRC67_16515 [Inquilinus sp.]|uniref:hypothetical protein n=1 Tax=Inquilinus sp. TaxID=1932117 RepID=UPI003F2E5E9E
MTEDRPWQRRLKAAGLTQRQFANIVGRLEKTVSNQIRGRLKGGVPKHLKVIIMAWELMNEEQRKRWLDMAQAESGDDEKATAGRKDANELESENEALRAQVEELMQELRARRK